METEFVPCLHFNVLNYKGVSAERRHGDTEITVTSPKKCCLLCTFVSIRRVSLAKSTSCTLRKEKIVSFRVSLLSPLIRVDNTKHGEDN